MEYRLDGAHYAFRETAADMVELTHLVETDQLAAARELLRKIISALHGADQILNQVMGKL